MSPILVLLASTGAHALVVPDDHPDLPSAVAAASPGELIELRSGVWSGSVVIDKDLEIRALGPDTHLEGDGAEIIRVTGATVTLVGLGLRGELARRALVVEDGATVALHEVHCVGGVTDGAGGCALVTGSALTATRSVFEGNTASGQGGHLAAFDATVSLTDCDLVGGRAELGGAIYAEDSTLALDGAVMQLNESGLNGGAVRAVQMLLVDVSRSWFVDNVTHNEYNGWPFGMGGAISLSGNLTPAEISDSLFGRNDAEYGGAVMVESGAGLRLSDSVFIGNTSLRRGGAVHVEECDLLEVEGAWMEDNAAGNDGGGLFVGLVASVEVRASVFRGNRGRQGGGVSISTDGSVVRDTVLCANEATGMSGGGLYFTDSYGGAVSNSAFLYNRSSFGGGGLSVEYSFDMEVTNNTFLSNEGQTGAHVRVHSSGSGTRLVNNVLAWSRGVAVDGEESSGVESHYNLFHDNDGGDLKSVDISSNHLLLDPALASFLDDGDCAPDLRPAAGSPLLAAGDPAVLQPDGSRSDIGAFGGAGGSPGWYADADGDGVSAIADCHDGDPALGPDARWHWDADGDGFGDPAIYEVGCVPPGLGWVLDGTDCDDENPLVHTEAIFYVDNDGDGYGDPASAVLACYQPPDTITVGGDCDDDDPTVNPETVWYLDLDGDGFGDADNLVVQCEAPDHGVRDDTDCDDSDPLIHPETVWYPDNDGDGYGAGSGFVACEPDSPASLTDDDCDDADPGVHPGAVEVCNGVDDDCNGLIDDGLPILTWYLDADGDGYGDPATSVEDCGPPDGYVADGTDCDDTDPESYPGNGLLDDDCEPIADTDPPSGDDDDDDDDDDLADADASGGCGCSTSGGGGSLPGVALLTLFGLARRRRVSHR